MNDPNEILCTECEAEFKIIHDEVDDPIYCPFCSAELDNREEIEKETEEE